MTMPRLLSVFTFVLLSYPSAGSGIFKEGILGDSLTITSGLNCEEGEGSHWYYMANRIGDQLRVSDLVNNDRIKPVTDGGNASLIFKRTIYNDRGVYTHTCGATGQDYKVHLNITIPYEKVVFEGQNATLSCYSYTTTNVTNIRWKRGGDLVYELGVDFENVSYGTGFEDRLSVSLDGYREGDLSLTLKEAQQADQGLFYCYHDKDRGKPDAVKLTVIPSTAKKGDESMRKGDEAMGKGDCEAMGKGDEAMGKEDEAMGKGDEAMGKEDEAMGKEDEAMGTGTAVIIAVFVAALISALLGMWCGWRMKSRMSNVSISDLIA